MKLSKELKAKIQAFSTRFSYDDWMLLNTKINFLEAIEAGDFEKAEVIAHEILSTK